MLALTVAIATAAPSVADTNFGFDVGGYVDDNGQRLNHAKREAEAEPEAYSGYRYYATTDYPDHTPGNYWPRG